MVPAFIDPGAVGSPVDVATLLVVLVTLVHEIRPRNRLQSAAIVGLARLQEDVDDEQLAARLEVDDRDVAALLDERAE